MIERRTFLRFATAVLAPAAISATAQQPAPAPRVGVVSGTQENFDAFVAALGERGYVDGRTVAIERRRSGDELFSPGELAQLAVVVVGGPYRVTLAMNGSKVIPIVAVDLESDPVASGFAQSLARPGGRVTGVFLDLPELGGKQIQLLREVAPAMRRVGILWDEEIARPQYDATVRGALAAGLSPVSLPYRSLDLAKIEAAFDRARAERVDGLVILTAPLIARYFPQIADLALKHRLPTISPFNRFPRAGGALAYGPDLPDMFRQLAGYVDRILKGAKPGDLAIQRPSRFVMVINVKTVKALGLTVPPSLLARADEVIQ